jgi:8-oxo-dGTP pyrophosphatase MutT (NUDIX family)
MTDVRDDQLPKGAGGAAEVPPIPSASVIVLRGRPLEVLFLRRTTTSSFVPDVWVFPGGAVDPIDRALAERCLDGSELDAMRICALRELFEESGIWLGQSIGDAASARRRLLDDQEIFSELFAGCAQEIDRLVWTSRWVTPIGVPKRFDTYFFLLEVDESTEATPEHREGVEVRWLSPAEALRLHEAGEFPLVFPTIRNLREIAQWDDPAELIESRRDVEVAVKRPVLVVDGGRKQIFLPDEP